MASESNYFNKGVVVGKCDQNIDKQRGVKRG